MVAAKAAAKFARVAGKTPQMSLVRLADHSSEARQDIEMHNEDVLNSLQDLISPRCAQDPETMRAASRWIEDRFDIIKAGSGDRKSQRPLRVHAEAGLMALIREADAP